MSPRLLGSAFALPLLIAATLASAEDQPAASPPASAEWKVPRTAWGDPDLRGNWPIDYLGATPRVRPASFGTRAYLTDEEYAAALKAAQAQLTVYAQEDKVGKMGMGHWTERGLPLRQTSLIMEPADGQIPAMTAEGERRASQMKSSWTEQVFNGLEDFSPYDLCISRGMPSSMLPGAYNSGIEVWQAPGLVAIRLEMIHETRLIPIGAAPPPADVKAWLGFSRGHWQGDTLVIETTNFRPGSPIGNVGNYPRPVPNSDQMKVVEKLTPVGPDEIHYEAWIEDPVVLSAPFKLDFPWRRNSDYVQYEYACHEGNEQTRGYIEGTGTTPAAVAAREKRWKAREAEAEAAAKVASGQ